VLVGVQRGARKRGFPPDIMTDGTRSRRCCSGSSRPSRRCSAPVAGSAGIRRSPRRASTTRSWSPACRSSGPWHRHDAGEGLVDITTHLVDWCSKVSGAGHRIDVRSPARGTGRPSSRPSSSRT
jgi:hypothetical protein